MSDMMAMNLGRTARDAELQEDVRRRMALYCTTTYAANDLVEAEKGEAR